MLTRALALVQELTSARFGLRSVDLAARLEVSRATVDRDLRMLREAGVPIARERRNGEVRHRLDSSPLPPLQPTPSQAVALRLAAQLMQPLAGTRLARELSQLLDAAPHAPNETEVVSHAPAPPSPATIVATLEAGIRSHRRIEFRYRSASGGGEAHVYEVEPLGLRLVGHDLYLRAYVPARSAHRTFKIVRIAEARLLGTRFAAHDPSADDRATGAAVKIWDGAPVDIVVRLSPRVAHIAREYPLVADQQIELAHDGSVIVRARVAGIVEARRWVLSWGAAAEALAPFALRDAVRSELTETLRAYTRRPARRADKQPRAAKLSDAEATPREKKA